MKRWNIIWLLFGALLIASGCQVTPKESAVTSKNDGAFEAAIRTGKGTESGSVPEKAVTYQASFTSADGNIAYTVDAEIPAVNTAVSVLRVTPHEIAAQEAMTVAEALFGDAKLYEYTGEMSKSELEEEILSLRQKLGDYDSLLMYYGGDEDLADYMCLIYESQLEKYESLYQIAADTVEPELCQWTFYPESHYWEMAKADSMYILAETEMDGLPYLYSVCNRNKSDYRIHSIFVYTDTDKITADEVYSMGTAYPSEKEVEALRDAAETMLKKMGLSNWIIDTCRVEEGAFSDDQTAYTVVITALPTYDDIPMIRLPQIGNLKTDDAYASNYYYETIEMEFCGGNLTFFEYQAPLELVQTISDNVDILSGEEIASLFEDQMKLDDITSYEIQGIPEELKGQVPQITSVEANVTSVEFGLVRTRIKNDFTDFYLVPAYSFKGTYKGTYSDGNEDMVKETTFVTINAVDGSIINTQLGY